MFKRKTKKYIGIDIKFDIRYKIGNLFMVFFLSLHKCQWKSSTTVL